LNVVFTPASALNGQGLDSGTDALFGAVVGKLDSNNWEAFGMLDGEVVELTRHTISTALLEAREGCAADVMRVLLSSEQDGPFIVLHYSCAEPISVRPSR
jgi:hypothetical protein